MTDPAKAKIIEAVPELVPNCSYGGTIKTARPITLADVLRAIQKVSDYSAASLGGFTRDMLNLGWNLTTDYDGQTAEVKEFLGKLLGV